MTLVLEAEAKKTGPSVVVQAGALLLMTAIAVAMGWYTGSYLQEHWRSASTAESAGDDDTATGGEVPRRMESAAATSLVPLDPITTNLGEPTDIWIRMELTLVFNGVADPVLAQEIHQDFFAYMRTVKLRQIESASGFQHLKADLRERARIRSDGRASDILVTTFLYE